MPERFNVTPTKDDLKVPPSNVVDSKPDQSFVDSTGGMDLHVAENPKSRAWDLLGGAYWNRGYDGGPSPVACIAYLSNISAGDPALLVGASTIRLAFAALNLGVALTIADFSRVMLTELRSIVGDQAAWLLADVTRPGALPAESFQAVLGDRLINRFTLGELRVALTNMTSALRPGGELRLSYREGLYDRDLPVIEEARRRGRLEQIFDEEAFDIDYSSAASWLAKVLPAHGEIDMSTLVAFYAARGSEHRLRRGELDTIISDIANELGWGLHPVHHPMSGQPKDHLLVVRRER
jgi:hypothetical protein